MKCNYKFEGLQYTHNKYKSNLASFDSVPFFRCGILAGYSGILQSSIWGITSIIFLIVYKIQDPDLMFNYCNIITIFYDTFIRKHEKSVSFKVMVVMGAILFLQILWLISSISLLVTLHVLRWPSDTKKYSYNCWALITLLICISDFIIAMIFITHFVKNMTDEISNEYRHFYSLNLAESVLFDETYFEGYIIAVVIFILFVLRGIIVWGLNLMYSAVIITMNFVTKRNLRTTLSNSRKTQTEKIFPLERAVNMTESKSLYSKASEIFEKGSEKNLEPFQENLEGSCSGSGKVRENELASGSESKNLDYSRKPGSSRVGSTAENLNHARNLGSEKILGTAKSLGASEENSDFFRNLGSTKYLGSPRISAEQKGSPRNLGSFKEHTGSLRNLGTSERILSSSKNSGSSGIRASPRNLGSENMDFPGNSEASIDNAEFSRNLGASKRNSGSSRTHGSPRYLGSEILGSPKNSELSLENVESPRSLGATPKRNLGSSRTYGSPSYLGSEYPDFPRNSEAYIENADTPRYLGTSKRNLGSSRNSGSPRTISGSPRNLDSPKNNSKSSDRF